MQVTSASVVNEIAKFTNRSADSIQADTPLRNLVIESFVLVELVIELQETFGIRLNQEDLANVSTVADLIAVLEQKQS